MNNPNIKLLVLLIFTLTSISFSQAGKGVGNISINKLPPKEKRWALIVGINDYEKDVSTLKGAVNDAKALKDVLVKYAGFPENQIILLTSDAEPESRPNRENILEALSDLSEKVPGDGLLLFSFSGHGVSVGNQAYLIPSNGRITKNLSLLKSLSIDVADIKQAIQQIKVSQVLMLLDACRNEPGRGETPNLLTKAYKKGFSFNVANSRVKAFATLYATSIEERAFEFYEKNTRQYRGYFSFAVEEALSGKAANNKCEVTLRDLIDYIEGTVPTKVDKEKRESQFPSHDLSDTYKASELVLAISNECLSAKKEPPKKETPKNEFSIISPQDQAEVGVRLIVKGKISDTSAKVFVLVHPLEGDKIWVQEPATVSADGLWETVVTIGEPSVHQGQRFAIRAVANPKAELHKGDILYNWAEAQWSSQIIEVIRK